MSLTYKGQSEYWKDLYVASGLSDTVPIAEGDYTFTLQGDDTIYFDLLRGAVLVGGSGDDTYVVRGRLQGKIMDAGGGIDTLSFEGMTESEFFSQIKVRKATQVNTDYSLDSGKISSHKTEHNHLQFYKESDFYISEELVIYDYGDPRSSIDLIKFDDSTLTIQDLINKSISSNIYSEGSTLISSGSNLTAIEHNSSSSEIYELQSKFEAEAGFTRSSYSEDVASIGRLYQASFNRIPDGEGLNNWINAWENGWELSSIATEFLKSEEFNKLYGVNSTNEDYISSLYNNTLGREPDPSGYQAWLSLLDNNVQTRSSLLVHFSESVENIERTEEVFSQLSFNGEQWLLPDQDTNLIAANTASLLSTPDLI